MKRLLLTNTENLTLGELAIREIFFEELAITGEEVVATPIAPTAYHYIPHIYRRLIEGTPKTAAASTLSYFWLYREIGAQLVKQHSPELLYQRWIEAYVGGEMCQHVQEERRLLDQLCEENSSQEQAAMITAFVISGEMEYAFWEMAYTHKTWIG